MEIHGSSASPGALGLRVAALGLRPHGSPSEKTHIPFRSFNTFKESLQRVPGYLSCLPNARQSPFLTERQRESGSEPSADTTLRLEFKDISDFFFRSSFFTFYIKGMILVFYS